MIVNFPSEPAVGLTATELLVLVVLDDFLDLGELEHDIFPGRNKNS